VVLDKKDRDEYVKKRDMVASKMTPAQIVEPKLRTGIGRDTQLR
jgi:hypothetical protein